MALGVLLELEKIKNNQLRENLLQEVDYFSTVSGGGLAVGFYLTKLHNFFEYQTNIQKFSLQEETNKILMYDDSKPNPLRADLMQYAFQVTKKV